MKKSKDEIISGLRDIIKNYYPRDNWRGKERLHEEEKRVTELIESDFDLDLTYVLIQTEFNWADEIDDYGFTSMSLEHFIGTFNDSINVLEDCLKNRDSYYYGIGSNQGIDIHSVKEYVQGVSFSFITKEQHEFLIKTFGKYGHYHCSAFPIDAW